MPITVSTSAPSRGSPAVVSLAERGRKCVVLAQGPALKMNGCRKMSDCWKMSTGPGGAATSRGRCKDSGRPRA